MEEEKSELDSENDMNFQNLKKNKKIEDDYDEF